MKTDRLPRPIRAVEGRPPLWRDWRAQTEHLAHLIDPFPIVRQIVDRQHVGARTVDALRAVVEALRDKRDTWRGLEPWQRRELVAAVVRQHAENRTIYREVMC